LEQRNSHFTPPASATEKTDGPVGELFGGESRPSISAEIESVGKRSAIIEESQATKIPSRSGNARRKDQPIVMPLVFRNVDLDQLSLNPEQLQAVDDLRQRFVEEIGGLQQDLSDPTYAERWQRSQPELDNDLRGIIGIAAFENYQVAAAALAEQTVQ
jgi:hypothetical protein